MEANATPVPSKTSLIYQPIGSAKRTVLVAAGSFFVGMGVLGAVLPGVPSTIFFILAAACYTRSSEKLYRWLLGKPIAQKALQQYADYQKTKALPLSVKLIAMGAAWSSFLLMAFAPSRAPWFVKWLVLAAALACSAFMLSRKTATA